MASKKGKPFLSQPNNNNIQNPRNEAIAQKLDKIENLINSISDRVVEVSNKQANVLEKLADLETHQVELEEQLANQVNQLKSDSKKTFYEKEAFINEAAKIGIDMNIDFTYNGQYILTKATFKNSNVNLYGCALLDHLYTREELINTVFEYSKKSKNGVKRGKARELSPTRTNLIKACYLVKLKNTETFVQMWPNIVQSLNQKCRDSKKKPRATKSKRGENNNVGGDDDDDNSSDKGEEDDENDEDHDDYENDEDDDENENDEDENENDEDYEIEDAKDDSYDDDVDSDNMINPSQFKKTTIASTSKQTTKIQQQQQQQQQKQKQKQINKQTNKQTQSSKRLKLSETTESLSSLKI